jgi:O-antigen/teichoic acid export membrane protein
MLAIFAAAGWGQLAAAIVSLLAIRLYTASMAAALFGEAMLVLGVLTLVDGMLSMAFSQAMVSFLKDHDQRQERLALGLGFGADFAILILCVGVFASLVASIAWMNAWVSAQIVFLILAVLAYAISEPIRVIGQTVALLERRFMAFSAWQTADAIATVGATLGFLSFFEPSFATLTVGVVAGRLVSSMIFWLLLYGARAFKLADISLARADRRRVLEFALPVSAMAPLGWISLNLDRYIVGIVSGAASAGLLAVLAGAVTRPYSISSAALTNYFRPDLIDQAANRATTHKRPLLAWLAFASVVSLAGLLLIVVFGDAIVSFLIRFDDGDAEEVGSALIALIALSQVFVLLTHAIDNQILVLRRSRSLLISQLAAVALGLPMIVAGALIGGVVGAAWGRVVNEAAKLVVAAWLLRHINRVPHPLEYSSDPD